jgi:HAD superfamily hydrolase (TIGR01509 family)
MPYQALLFDFNGTISLDEELSNQAWEETFTSFGLGWSRDSFFAELVGHNSAMIAQEGYRLATGEEPARAWLEQAVQKRVEIGSLHLEAGDTIAPETVAVLEELAEHYRLALVTSAPRSLVDSEAGAAGILELFTVIVAAEDVSVHKPDPEPYLQALDRLEVLPRDGLAFEDSRPGVRAAQAAGLDVVLVGEWAPKDLEVAGHIESVAELRPHHGLVRPAGALKR